jgi:DNA gyrase subunit B
LIDIGVQADFIDILGGGVEDELHKLELVEATDERITLRVQEKLSNLATVYRVPRSMFGEEEFRELARLHITLQGFIGSGPFHVGLDRHEGKKVTSAPLVRSAVVEMAKEGVSLQRFKGLGEMNPDQLFATTMDPARRTLMRVTIDDATAADLVFSMLMGEEVPPRRQFIEDHARNVDNLDI